MNRMELAQTIQALRKEKGLSQKELGAQLGVSNKAVSKWETGEALPKTETIMKMAELFEMDISELMGSEPAAAQEALRQLQEENDLLRQRLIATQKRKKKTRLLIAAMSAAVLLFGVIAALLLGNDGASERNRGIRDAGKEGTVITLGEDSFQPLTALDELFFSESARQFGDVKYAQYTDLSEKTVKVSVYCDEGYDYIILPHGSKEYRYMREACHATLTSERVERITLYQGVSVADAHAPYHQGDDTYQYHDYLNYSWEFAEQRTFIEAFCRFYQNRQPVADKRLTERYLGNCPYLVEVSIFQDIGVADGTVGEFFSDSTGNGYFYDYCTGESYAVGEELMRYVKR